VASAGAVLAPALVAAALGAGCTSERAADEAGGVAALETEAGEAPAAVGDGLAFAYRVAGEGPAPATLEVTLELPPDAPGRWWFEDPPAFPVGLEAVAGDGERTPVPLEDGQYAEVPSGTRRLVYGYPVGEVARRRPSLDRGRGRPGAGYVVAGERYLLRPARPPARTGATLELDGLDAVLPWARPADGVYRLDRYDVMNPGYHTFGGRRRTVAVGESELVVVRLPGELRARDDQLVGWIERAARELLTYRARLPYARVVVTLAPTGGGGEASPFGSFLWSRPPSVAVLVRSGATPRDLEEDWVAVHELSHMMHPFFRPRRPWLSEGIATYYQNVARIRSGRLTPREGWGNLLAGVRRGQGWDESLAELSEAMHRRRAYMPVYWGGAVFALELDLELRRTTGGARSLDDALARLADAGPTARLEDLSRVVDGLAGEPLFDRLLARHLEGPALEEADGILGALGVGEGPDGAVRLGDAAPRADLRRAIAAGE